MVETSPLFQNTDDGIFLFCSVTSKCTIISQIIISNLICEIIVHLLVIVQNHKRCTVHVLK